jgi:hypothetical protein
VFAAFAAPQRTTAAMDIDSGNPATVIGIRNSDRNVDIERAGNNEKLQEKTPVADEKLEDEPFDDFAEPALPFSKARLIGLVLCLSLAAFLNVSPYFLFLQNMNYDSSFLASSILELPAQNFGISSIHNHLPTPQRSDETQKLIIS